MRVTTCPHSDLGDALGASTMTMASDLPEYVWNLMPVYHTCGQEECLLWASREMAKAGVADDHQTTIKMLDLVALTAQEIRNFLKVTDN